MVIQNPLYSKAATLTAEQLRAGYSVSIRTDGLSMSPTIQTGDTVVIDPIMKRPVRCGMILLYLAHNRCILHRCVGRERGTRRLLCTGDAALKGIESIEREAVIGVGVSVRRHDHWKALHTRKHRAYGMIRYFVRPLRRLFAYVVHTATPAGFNI